MDGLCLLRLRSDISLNRERIQSEGSSVITESVDQMVVSGQEAKRAYILKKAEKPLLLLQHLNHITTKIHF